MFDFENYTYVSFKYERLTLFCFYCAQLGHNDSFCHIRTSKREELVDMGWDLSLRAPSKHAAVMSSVWLVEEKVWEGNESNNKQSNLGNGSR